MTWHRGDRVIALPVKQRAVVEGWKTARGRVLLLFGVRDNRPIRAWYRDEDVIPDPEPTVVWLPDQEPPG